MNELALDNPQRLARIQRVSLIIAAVALSVAAALALVDSSAFFEGYLAAYVLWISAALGCMAMLMVHHLTGGRWGWSIRRPLEAGVLAVPILCVLFLPLLPGVHALYPWATGEPSAKHALIDFRSRYLTVPFYIIRTIFYLLALSAIGILLFRASSRQHDEEDRAQRTRLQRLSCIGAIVYVLIVTFAFFDWVASIEKEWASSIYGMYIIAGQALTAFTIVLVITILVRRPRDDAAHKRILPDHRLQDLGTLLFVLIILYVYMAFSQFFISWNGNLPDEIKWYVHRQEGGWGVLTIVLIVINFFLPFAALLSRDLKRSARMLLAVAMVVLVARLLDAAWIVLPSFHQLEAMTIPVALVSAVGLGSVFLAVVLWHWQRRPLAVQEIPSGEDDA